MKKFTINLTGKFSLILLMVCVLFFSYKTFYKNKEREKEGLEQNEVGEEENDMYDEAAAAQKFEFEKTKDPALGYVPKDRLFAAFQYAERSKQKALSSRTANTLGTWVERGPNADLVGPTNGNTRDGINPVAAGRMRAIWVDLNDATGNTVWVGGVDGGLWKTTNFKTSPANWAPVNDFFTNMSISSICQDPLNKNIMYFCTGEAYFNFDAVRGNGVFKSTDNGVSWSQLSGTSIYTNCSKILCDAAGNIYLGTANSGLVRSTAASGGLAWTDITPSGLISIVADFEISSTGRLHVSMGLGNTTSGGYRYTDNSASVTPTWTSPATPFPFPSGANCRVELACLGNTLYALLSNITANVTKIYRSSDGGATWAATSTTPSFTNGQAWYCLAADINPANSNNLIIGSLDCWASSDGGNSWTQISDWASGGTSGKYVHGDQQIIKWNAANEILIGTDGGIFYSPDAGVTISDRNSGLRIKQFFSCDYHPTLTDYFLAGAQDNGCHQFTTPGLNTTTEITGGDGAIVHIDQTPLESNYQFGAYVRNRYRRTNDSWATAGGFAAVNFFRSGTTASPVDFGSFINPTDYDNTANIMYSGSDAGEFFRWTTAKTTPEGNYFFTGNPSAFPVGAKIIAISNLSGIVSSVKVSPYIANRIYLGTGSSKLIRIDNANTIATNSTGTDISGASFPAGATISCIAVGSDDSHLMVCFSNYGVSNIWVTINGGTSWTTIDGNLPDMPVRWAVYDPASDTKAWIATETGVWSTAAFSGGTTSWTASPGFPTVRTDMIKLRPADQTLIAATHGRGLWTMATTLSTLPIDNFVLRGNWKTNSTVELSWDYSNSVSASFDIESSGNGTYYTKAGASSSTTFTDQITAQDIYYRIKGKNIFGNVSYSNVVHLQKGSDIKDFTEIKIFPNPVKDEINIGFATAEKGLINYKIASINGQVMWKKDEEISVPGECKRSWNMQHLKRGAYVFTIIYNGKKLSKKFTKL